MCPIGTLSDVGTTGSHIAGSTLAPDAIIGGAVAVVVQAVAKLRRRTDCPGTYRVP